MIVSLAFLSIVPVLGNYAHILREQIAYGRFARGTIGLTAYMTVGGFYEAISTTYKSMIVALTTEPVARSSELPDIRLRLGKGTLDALLSDRPASTRARYYKAELKYPDGKWRRVNYRLRGSSSWHHQVTKPSIRLKLRRENPIGLLRHINLINPEDRPMLANILADDIAREMGVLSHVSRFVRLFINDRYYGVYQMQTRGDEEMLRHQGRVPGPLYLGENLERNWKTKDFEHKGEIKFHESLPIVPLTKMLAALRQEASPEKFDALWSILDFDKYARYSAVTALVDTWHIDAFHNQGFYFDPSRGLIEPMLLDANGHGMTTYPGTWRRFTQPWKPHSTGALNGLNHPLTDVAMRDPRFRHARNQQLWEALEGVASTESQHKMMQAYFRKIDRDVYADQHKGSIYRSFVGYTRFLYTNANYDTAKRQMFDWVAQRNEFLRTELSKTSVRVLIKPREAGNKVDVEVLVDGNSAASLDTRDFAGTVLADANLDGTAERPVEKALLLHPGLYADPDYFYEHVTYGRPDPKRTFFGGVQRYRLTFTRQPDLKQKLAKAFNNGVTGKTLQPTWIEDTPPETERRLSENVSIHPWRLWKPEPPGEIVLGPGRVVIQQNLVVGKQQTLRILPGTEILLAPGTSLISRGRLTMEGTASLPISVRRLDPDIPWGALLIMGPSAADSRISHARIAGGSKAMDGLLSLLGMVNVHWVPSVSIRDTTIASNKVSDDTLHIIHSKFSLKNLTMDDCAFDCIDLDYAEGDIRGLNIGSAGNDGVDFMESEVALTDIRVGQAGDKGLSVGEGSKISAANGSVGSAEIGIAVKDSSHLDLTGWKIHDSKIAIDVYKKNWRYGRPGTATIKRTELARNPVNIRVAKKAEIVVYGSTPPPRIQGEGKVLMKQAPAQ